MKVVVYADFNCVYCYPASQRADRLTREDPCVLGGCDAYLCGPPAMIDAAVELVTRRVVRPRNVHFDAFVPTG